MAAMTGNYPIWSQELLPFLQCWNSVPRYWAILLSFPGHKKVAGSEAEEPGQVPAPIRNTGTASRGVASWAIAPIPGRRFELWSRLETPWKGPITHSTSVFYFIYDMFPWNMSGLLFWLSSCNIQVIWFFSDNPSPRERGTETPILRICSFRVRSPNGLSTLSATSGANHSIFTTKVNPIDLAKFARTFQEPCFPTIGNNIVDKWHQLQSLLDFSFGWEILEISQNELQHWIHLC